MLESRRHARPFSQNQAHIIEFYRCWSTFFQKDCQHLRARTSCRYRKMLQRELFLLANIGFDTAESGPSEGCYRGLAPSNPPTARIPNFQRSGSSCRPHFSKMHFSKMHFSKMHFSKILQILAGWFSAVSKRIFARKYAFDSIFQALQDLHTFAPLQSQNFNKKSV